MAKTNLDLIIIFSRAVLYAQKYADLAYSGQYSRYMYIINKNKKHIISCTI